MSRRKRADQSRGIGRPRPGAAPAAIGELSAEVAKLLVGLELDYGTTVQQIAALLTSEPRSATVVARLPTTVLELQRSDFLRLVERHPLVLTNLVRVIGDRLVTRNVVERHGRRGEAVAVIAGRGARALVEPVITATRNALPTPSANFHIHQSWTIGMMMSQAVGISAPWLFISSLVLTSQMSP